MYLYPSTIDWTVKESYISVPREVSTWPCGIPPLIAEAIRRSWQKFIKKFQSIFMWLRPSELFEQKYNLLISFTERSDLLSFVCSLDLLLMKICMLKPQSNSNRQSGYFRIQGQAGICLGHGWRPAGCLPCLLLCCPLQFLLHGVCRGRRGMHIHCLISHPPLLPSKAVN